jgi:acetoacetate decarboxylase
MLTLTFVRYDDTDLDAYHEVGVVFLVQGPAGRGVYIRHLPVDQDFTLAAGRQLWGFPKTLADIVIEETENAARCTLRQDGAEVLELRIRRGVVPVPQPTIPTYTNLDGRVRKTTWQVG